MIQIMCVGRPTIPPVLHGYEFTPLDGTFTGRWGASIKDEDAPLFVLGLPGSPFSLLAPAPLPAAPAEALGAPLAATAPIAPSLEAMVHGIEVEEDHIRVDLQALLDVIENATAGDPPTAAPPAEV